MADLMQNRSMNLAKVRNLLGQAAQDLVDAKNAKEISAYRRFVIAYEAILRCGLAVMELRRLNPVGEGHHQTILQELASTLGFKNQVLAQLQAMSKARNDVTYRGVFQIVDASMLTTTLQRADSVCNETEAWVKKHHPTVFGG